METVRISAVVLVRPTFCWVDSTFHDLTVIAAELCYAAKRGIDNPDPISTLTIALEPA